MKDTCGSLFIFDFVLLWEDANAENLCLLIVSNLVAGYLLLLSAVESSQMAKRLLLRSGHASIVHTLQPLHSSVGYTE